MGHIIVWRPGQIARPMPIGCAQARKASMARPTFWAPTFCLAKKKNSFDLQISRQIDKIMKKLQ